MAPLVWTIVVAAGSGHRFGGPKQFEDLGGRPLLAWAAETAAACSDGVVVVLPPGHEPLGPGEVHGGASRSESVRCGLGAVPAEATVIVVHDAARPLAPVSLFESVVAAVAGGADAAVPGLPVTDTIKVVDAQGVVVDTPDRHRLVAVHTPPAFRADTLRRVHAPGGEATDDAALVEAAGGRVVVVPGAPEARKITQPEDLAWARAMVVVR
jgi:2-C-methyl-D-erythritol 4-phosphate cytidylyltransferase